MVKGNQATDGGHLFIDRREREELIQIEPDIAQWIRPVMGASEFLNGKERWCLWFVDAELEKIKANPVIAKKLLAIKELRIMAGHSCSNKNVIATTYFHASKSAKKW